MYGKFQNYFLYFTSLWNNIFLFDIADFWASCMWFWISHTALEDVSHPFEQRKTHGKNMWCKIENQQSSVYVVNFHISRHSDGF